MSLAQKFSSVAGGMVTVIPVILFLYLINIFETAWAPFLVGGCLLASKAVSGSFLPTGRFGRWMMRPLIGLFCLFFVLWIFICYNFEAGAPYAFYAYGDTVFWMMYLNLFVLGGYVFFSLRHNRLWHETDALRVFFRSLWVVIALFWLLQCSLYADLWDGTYVKYPWYRVAPFFKAFSPDERVLFTVLMQSVSLAFLVASCVSVIRFNRQTAFWMASALFMVFFTSDRTFYWWWKAGTLTPWTGYLLGPVVGILLTFRFATGTFFPKGRALWILSAMLLALIAGDMLIWMQGRVVFQPIEMLANLIGLGAALLWFAVAVGTGCIRVKAVCPRFLSRRNRR